MKNKAFLVLRLETATVTDVVRIGRNVKWVLDGGNKTLIFPYRKNDVPPAKGSKIAYRLERNRLLGDISFLNDDPVEASFFFKDKNVQRSLEKFFKLLPDSINYYVD